MKNNLLEAVRTKLFQLGGNPEDLNRLRPDLPPQRYEKFVQRVAEEIVQLAQQPEGDFANTVLEVNVDYSGNLTDELKAENRGLKVHIGCDAEAPYGPMPLQGDISESIRLKQFDNVWAKKVVQDMGKSGWRTCSVRHAQALLKKAQTDEQFKSILVPLLPIIFVGATYRGDFAHYWKRVYPVLGLKRRGNIGWFAELVQGKTRFNGNYAFY